MTRPRLGCGATATGIGNPAPHLVCVLNAGHTGSHTTLNGTTFFEAAGGPGTPTCGVSVHSAIPAGPPTLVCHLPAGHTAAHEANGGPGWEVTSFTIRSESAPPKLTKAQEERRRRARHVKIVQLEEKSKQQRAHITRLEECRRFEHETEQLLVSRLREVLASLDGEVLKAVGNESPNLSALNAHLAASRGLAEYTYRLGPRPVEGER